jgi:hypothetical protein
MNQEDKETEDWLALLAGKSVANADPKLVWEANALRAELAYRHNPPTLNPKILDNVLAQLPPVKPSLWEVLQNIWTDIWSKLWEQRIPIGAAMATSVLIVIAIWQIIIPQPVPRPDFIAKPLATSQTLKVANPQATAKELKMALEQLGISATIIQKNEVWILEVLDLSTNNPEELSTLLEKYDLVRLPAPEENLLTVRIKKNTTP